jgi:hypothetical protein
MSFVIFKLQNLEISFKISIVIQLSVQTYFILFTWFNYLQVYGVQDLQCM